MSDDDTIAPHSDFTRSQENAFHEGIMRDTNAYHDAGRLGTSVNTRYQIRWICNHCREMHKVTGTMDQVQNTATCMMLLGYPLVLVHDLAFLEFMHSYGDVEDMGERIKIAAEEYNAYCAHTRGG